MVFFLIFDILGHRRYLGFAVGKRPVAALPFKLVGRKSVSIDPFRGAFLNPPHEFRHRLRCVEAEEDVHVVIRAAYRKRLVPLVVDDGDDVFVQGFPPVPAYQGRSVLHRKYGVYLDLRVDVWHGVPFMAQLAWREKI